jgi:beta-lactamase class A
VIRRRLAAIVLGIVVAIGSAGLFLPDSTLGQSADTAPVTERPEPSATVLPLAAPTIIPAPTATPELTAIAMSMLSPRGDARARIEAAMQSIVPLGSAEVIADGGAFVASYQADQTRVAASTIKLPLLVEVLRQPELGKVDLSQRVTIRTQDVVGGTGDLQFQVGGTFSFAELLQHMVLRSDNVAANILVDLVGMDSVNATAHADQAPNTSFRRHMLDTQAESAGIENITTAADLAEMLDRIAHGTLVSTSVSRQALSYLDDRGRIDKDWLGLNLPPGAQLSHINGTLTGVRNDVGLITSPSGQSFVLAVFQDHLSNEVHGEAAIANLARSVLDILDNG